MQTYSQFLQTTLTDRDKQEAYLDQMWRGSDTASPDARFSDLTREETARVLADVTGMPQFNRFAENKLQRGLDAMGSFTTGMFTDTRPADFTDWGGKALAALTGNDYIDPVTNTRSQKSFGESGADFGEATARVLGAQSPATIAGARAAGESLPSGLGKLTAMIGTGPAGLVTGLVDMYGGGLGQAYEKGVMGAGATGIGLIGPAVMAATVAAGKPVANWAAGKVASKFGGEAGTTALAAATASAVKYPGSVALAEAMGKASYPGRVGMKLAQEAVAQTVFSAGSVAGNVGTQIALDKDEFFATTVKSQEYWIPTLVGEIVNGVGGSTIGRLHDPIKTNATIQRERAAKAVAVLQKVMNDRGQQRLAQVDAAAKKPINPLVSSYDPMTQVTPGGDVAGNERLKLLTEGEDDLMDPNAIRDGSAVYDINKTGEVASRKGTAWERKGVEGIATDKLLPLVEVQRGTENDFSSVDKIQQQVSERGFDEPLTFTYDPKTGKGLLTDGNHRIVGAKNLGLSEVPIELNRQFGLYTKEVYNAKQIAPPGTEIRDIATLKRVLEGDEVAEVPAKILPGEKSDLEQFDAKHDEVRANAQEVNGMFADSYKAKVTLNEETGLPEVSESESPMAPPVEVVEAVLGNKGIVDGTVGLGQSGADKATHLVNAEVAMAHGDMPEENVVAHLFGKATGEGPKYHLITTTEHGEGPLAGQKDQIALLNNPTAVYNVSMDVHRVGEDGKSRPVKKEDGTNARVALTFSKLLDIANGRHDLRLLDEEAGVPLAPAEVEVVKKLALAVKAQYDRIPSGISWAEKSQASPQYRSSVEKFFDDLGLTAYFKATGKKLRFGARSMTFENSDVFDNALDYFGSRNNAAHVYADGLHYISHYDGVDPYRNVHEFDLEEMSHVIHDSIEEGAFGIEAAQELEKWLASATSGGKALEKFGPAQEGASMKLDLRNVIKSDTGEPLSVRPTGKDFDPFAEYMRERREMVAMTIQGVLMEKAGNAKMKNPKYFGWVKENFPKLFGLFQNIIAKFDGHRKRMNQYSPDYAQGREVIGAILDRAFEKKQSTSKLVLDTLAKNGVADDSRVGQMFAWLMLQKTSKPEQYTLMQKLEEVSNEFYDGDPETAMKELMLTHQLTNLVGSYAFDGATPREETLSHLPGFRWLQQASWKQGERLSKYFGEKTKDPVERAKLVEFFGSPETLGYVEKLSKDRNVYADTARMLEGDALNQEALEKAQAYVTGLYRMQTDAQNVLSKISEMIAVRDPQDRHALGATKYPAEVGGTWVPNTMYEEGYINAANKVARDWTLGRLEGQNGVPMYDPTGKVKGKRPDTDALEVMYPIMHRELLKAFKEAERELQMTKEDEGFIKADGSYKLGSKNPTKARMEFETREDAAKYVEEAKKNSANALVRMIVITEKSGKHFVKVRGNSRGVNAEVLTGTHNELIAPPDNFQDLGNAERVRAEGTIEYAKQKVASEFNERGGPSVMRRLSDVVPKIFARITRTLDSGMGFDAWKAKVDEFNDYHSGLTFEETRGFRALALQNGLPETATPLELAIRYVENRMESFDFWSKEKPKYRKTAQKMEASDIKWVEMTDPKLAKFIKNAYSVAYDIAEHEIYRSRQSLDGAAPMTDPGEAGKQAGLLNVSAMNDPDVLDGANAAARVVPGAQVGMPPTYARDAGFVRRALGSTVGVINGIHQWFGQGVQMRALYKKGWEWAGLRMSQELGKASAGANANLEPLAGYIDKTGDVWRMADRKGNDPKNAFELLKRNDTEWQRLNDIKRLEQDAQKSFNAILNSVPTTPEEVAALERAKSLRPTDEKWAAVHEEALWRYSQSGHRRIDNIIAKQPEITITELADMFKNNKSFTGNAADSEAIAARFYDAQDPVERLRILVEEANYKPDTATHVLDAFQLKEKFQREMHAMLKKNADWWVSEKRYEPFQVDIVMKKKPGEKDPRRGTYGFMSLDEAEAFVKQARSEGHAVGHGVIKMKDNATKYKSRDAENLADIIERKTNEISNLVAARMAGGQVQPDLIRAVLDTIQALPTDVTLEQESQALQAQLKGKQKLVEGREQLDMLSQHIKHSRAVPAAMERRHTDVKFRLYEKDPEIMKDLETFKVMNEFKKAIRYKDTEAQRQIGQAGYIMTMMANPSTGFVEAFQAPITMAPTLLEVSTNGLGMMQAQKVLAGLFKYASTAASKRLLSGSDESTWSPIHAAFIKEAVNQNRMNQRRYHDIDTNQTMEYLEKFSNQTGEARSGTKNAAHWLFTHLNNFYGFFSRFNAEVSGVSAFEVHMDNRFPGWLKLKFDDPKRQSLIDSLAPGELAEIQDKAMLTAETANGNLQRLGRPGQFNTQMPGQRNVASAMWSLQSYVNAAIANQLRWTKKWLDSRNEYTKAERVQARKALTMLFGMQTLAMGISGFTLFPAINKLVAAATGLDMEEEVRYALYDKDGATEEDKVFWGELFMHGAANALGSPIDYGTRLGIAGMGPFSAYSGIDATQMGGPLVGLATQAFRDIHKLRQGQMGIGEFGLNLLPVGMRRALRNEYFNDGQVLDGNKKFMFQPTAVERWTMALGFNTNRARKEMQARMQQTEGKLEDTARRERWSNEMMQAASAQDMAKVQTLLDQGVTEFGENRVKLARSVADKATEKVFGQSFSEGKGKQAQIAAALYPRVMSKATNVARAQHTQAYMQQLGVRPNVSRTSLRRAYGLDSLLTQNPSLSTGFAREALAGSPRGFTVFDTIREGPSVLAPTTQFGLGL